MIATAGLTALVLGLAVVVTRRRSVAIALMAGQSAVISVAALSVAPGRSSAFLVAAGVLVVKTLVLAGVLGYTVTITRERAPVRARFDPLLRLAMTLAALLLLNLLVPPVPSLDAVSLHASLSLVAIGIATVVLRRATILQLVGILVAENGIALAAVSLPGGLPAVIELGAVFDVAVVVSVAAAFHHRIYVLFGTGNSALLGELRD